MQLINQVPLQTGIESDRGFRGTSWQRRSRNVSVSDKSRRRKKRLGGRKFKASGSIRPSEQRAKPVSLGMDGARRSSRRWTNWRNSSVILIPCKSATSDLYSKDSCAKWWKMLPWGFNLLIPCEVGFFFLSIFLTNSCEAWSLQRKVLAVFTGAKQRECRIRLACLWGSLNFLCECVMGQLHQVPT